MLVDNPHMRSPTRRTWRPCEAVAFIEVLAARPGPPERRHTRSDRSVGPRGPLARSPAPLTGVAPFYSGLTRTDRAFSCTDEIVKTIFLFRLSYKLLLIFYGYTRRSQRHIPSESMSGISIED